MEYGRTQEQEMENALKQNRQPLCVYCNKPLDEIRQEQNEDIVWKWDKQLKQYKKSSDGTAEKPYHPACDSADWSYVDERLVSF
jgi:hypothetical protein